MNYQKHYVSSSSNTDKLVNAYLEGQSALSHCFWIGERCYPCYRLYTCQHRGAPDWRRRPPITAPSPFAPLGSDLCPVVVLWDADGLPHWDFGPSLLFASTPLAVSSRLCTRPHMKPGADNMPPPEAEKQTNKTTWKKMWSKSVN